MGLFNRFFRPSQKNAIQINDVSKNASMISPYVFLHKKNDKPLGNIFLQSVLNQIYNGVSNITFENLSTGKTITPEAIVHFIDNNAILLVNQYIRLGYITVFYNEKNEYRIPQDNEIKLDQYGRVINKHAVVIYSPQYQTERMSLLKLVIPLTLEINHIAGSDAYLTETLGCFGIISGQDIPLNPAGKKQLLESMSHDYGVADDKYKFLLANHDMKYTAIQPDIKALGFADKIDTFYRYICNIMGVPLQLIFSDKSTFNNVHEAKIYFYDSTVRSYSETLLKVAQELLTASNEFIPKSVITYKFNNLPELEKSLSAACTERMALLEYLKKLKELGQDVDKQVLELSTESKKLLKEI